MTVEVGDQLPGLGLSITNPLTGAPEDGGSVALTITLPDQTVVSAPAPLTISHPALGQYASSYITTQAGQHRVRWTVTGTNALVYVTDIQVEQFSGIVSLDEVKEHLQVRRSDEDETLRSLILAATAMCESPEGTGLVWTRKVVTGEVLGESGQLAYAPVISITSLVDDGQTLTPDDYDLSRNTGRLFPVDGWSSTRRGRVIVSYVAGTTAPIPAQVRDGTLEMVRHLYGIRRGGSGIPRQDEPDWNTSAGYLIPNRVAVAWRSAAGSGL